MGVREVLRARRELRREAEAAARALPSGPDDLSGAVVLWQSWGEMLGNRERVAPTLEGLARDGYAGSSIVFSLIAVRMLLFAEAVPRWFDTEKGRAIGDTDGLELLLQPWPGADCGELLARAELDVSLAGNSFTAHPADLSRLVRLRPDWVTIQRVERADNRGRVYSEVDGYWYGNPNDPDDWVFYEVDEVAHFSPYPDPLAEFRGMSWLTPVVREITQDHTMTQYTVRFFENAATPNMIVKYQQNLGPQKLAEAQRQIQQRHGGLDNSYKAMVLDSGADVTLAGNSFEQMNFNALRAATENRIASASGVPPMIVGFKEGLAASTLANYDAASRRLADMTMRPLWRGFAASLSRIVEAPRKQGRSRANLRLVFDASAVSALQEGAQARADTFKTKATTAGELIRGGYDPASVAEAVEAADLMLLEHTGKTPTALYDEEGQPANGKPGDGGTDGDGDGGDGSKPQQVKHKQGEGAAAPQPRSRGADDDVHPDDVRALLGEQREAMLEAFRAGMAAGRLTVVGADEPVRHLPGKHDQKSHAGGGGGSEGTSGSGDSPDDPIRTGDPDVAAKALYENKYVEFTQSRAVSTSLSKLKAMIDEAQARGEDKGTLNLCRATMAGTNLFCSENKGIPRVEMPQLSGKPLPGTPADGMPKNAKGEVDLGPLFREHLAGKGIAIRDDEVDASMLRATQSELQTSKVLGIAGAMRDGKVPDAQIFVTRDDYVVDGHHRWAAKVVNEFTTGKSLSQPVSVIDADIITILREANDFSVSMGIPQAGIGVPGRSVSLDDVVALEVGRSMLEWLHGA